MKILLSLPESPFDPTNGAARSMRTIGELMAAAGHQVRCVGTTATERPGGPTYKDWDCAGDLIGAGFRGVEYRLLDVHGASTKTWRTPEREDELDGGWGYTMSARKPDILLCYGGAPRDVRRFQDAKDAGVKIVFGLRNFGYPARGFLDFADGILTSSRFLSDWYKLGYGVESTSLPLPIWPEDVIAEKHEPKYFTAINPTREKGLMILQTVFEVLKRTRPDIPLLVVSDPIPALSGFVATVRPDHHVTSIGWQANPKEIYRQTKVLLVPSVWDEPAGRVIAEALLNGIPPIITDRGGMVETANGGAIVLPLAKHVTPSRSTPVGLDVAQPWIDTIIALHDGTDGYSRHVSRNNVYHRARVAGEMYKPENLTPLYEQYFEGILAGELTPAGCGAQRK